MSDSTPAPNPSPVLPNPLIAPPQIQPGSSIYLGRERRKHRREIVQGRAQLTVMDGSLAGSSYEVQTRDISQGGISFLLKTELAVGLTCRITYLENGRSLSHLCEIVRSRPLSSGKFEMALHFR